MIATMSVNLSRCAKNKMTLSQYVIIKQNTHTYMHTNKLTRKCVHLKDMCNCEVFLYMYMYVVVQVYYTPIWMCLYIMRVAYMCRITLHFVSYIRFCHSLKTVVNLQFNLEMLAIRR